MRKAQYVLFICFFSLGLSVYPESFRALITGNIEVSQDNPAGAPVQLGVNRAAVITLGAETRFLRGIEIELSAPQRWLNYRGTLAMIIHADLNRFPASGAADFEGRRLAFEPLPNKLQTIYQLPLRSGHGLRTTPYVTVPAGVTLPSSFPVLFRLTPIVKGLSEELETMVFQLNARPILSDEGAVRLSPRYPEQLRGRPFTVLIDDVLIENLTEELLLKEGEHHLVVLSNDYRNESRRFVVDRAKILDLTIELQDPTPLIIFEGPENARVFLDNAPVGRDRDPIPVEPGQHEARFQVGDYTIIKTLTIQRGKTYRVALAVDIEVLETE
jgi:hypothetical protein